MLETLIDLGSTCSKNEIYDSIQIYIYIYTVRVYIIMYIYTLYESILSFSEKSRGRFDVGYLSYIYYILLSSRITY